MARDPAAQSVAHVYTPWYNHGVEQKTTATLAFLQARAARQRRADAARAVPAERERRANAERALVYYWSTKLPAGHVRAA